MIREVPSLLLPLLLGALSPLMGCGGAQGPGSCPEGMVLIADGVAQIGVAEPLAAYEQPARSVRLDPYCIDRYEYPNRAGELPVHSVTWDEAKASCEAVGKRLCAADEWERACRGPQGWRYAYGAERDHRACNTPWYPSPPPDLAPPYAPSGRYRRCVSPEGVYDLNGNLSEWVADRWDGDPAPVDRDVPPGTILRTVRGGTMWLQTFYGQDCLSRHGHPPNGTYHDDGFRCCKDAR
jgi:eukaryotic-like serine/threonine-protein kinase